MLNELKRWELQLFADDGENVGGSDGVDTGNEPKETTPNGKEPDNKNAGDDVKKYTQLIMKKLGVDNNKACEIFRSAIK